MALNAADMFQRIYDNYVRILLMCTEVIANPTQQGIDALTVAAEGNAVLRAKLTYSLDGESYNWESFQSALVNELIPGAKRNMIFAQGPSWQYSSGR